MFWTGLTGFTRLPSPCKSCQSRKKRTAALYHLRLIHVRRHIVRLLRGQRGVHRKQYKCQQESRGQFAQGANANPNATSKGKCTFKGGDTISEEFPVHVGTYLILMSKRTPPCRQTRPAEVSTLRSSPPTLTSPQRRPCTKLSQIVSSGSSILYHFSRRFCHGLWYNAAHENQR